jgi:multiple sugar transport system substrate-binding protein
MIRRLALVLAVVVGIGVVGWAAPAPKFNVTVRVYGDAGHNLLPLEWYANEVKNLTGIDIKIIGVPFSDVYAKLKTEFVGGTGAYDLVIFFPTFIGEFAGLGYLRPLDDLAKKYDPKLDDVATAFRELYLKYGGKLYALPYDGDVLNYYYRRDLFENPVERANFKKKYGRDLRPPETWDEALQIAEFFTRKKGETLAGKTLDSNFYGYAFLGQRGFAYAWFLNHFAPRGGLYFDREMNPLINSEVGVRALDEFKKFLRFSPPDVLAFGYEELKNAFLQGSVATMVQWSDIWKKCQDPNQSKIVGKCGISHVPGIRSGGKVVFRAPMPVGRVLGVPQTTKVPEAAYWLAYYLSAVKSLDFVSDPRTGLDPFRNSHFNSPRAFAKFAPEAEAKSYLGAVKLNLDNGFPDLNIPGASEYLDKLDLNVTKALSGELSPKAALDAAAAEWKAITQRLGVDRQKQIYLTMLETWRKLGYLR